MRSGRANTSSGGKPLLSVHDSEQLGELVRTLKKELAAARAENRLLRVGKERAQTELRKAEYEGQQALKSGALVDGSGGGGASRMADARLLKQLKAKTRELQEELLAKEALVSELGRGGERGTRVRELEIQTKTYLEEARRLKEVARLQGVDKEAALGQQQALHTQALQQKDAQLGELRHERQRLLNENTALDEELGRWMEENERLRASVGRYEGNALPSASADAATARPLATGYHGGGEPAATQSELAALRAKLKDSAARLRQAQKDKERAEADKVAIFDEMGAAQGKLEAELRTERQRAARAERAHQKTREDLALAHAEVLRLKARINPTV